MNKDYERYIFHLIKQDDGEKFDSFVQRLHHQVKSCVFANPKGQLKMQLLANCSSNELRKKSFAIEMSLEQIILTGKTIELAKMSCTSSRPIHEENLNQAWPKSVTERELKKKLLLNNNNVKRRSQDKATQTETEKAKDEVRRDGEPVVKRFYAQMCTLRSD